MPRPSRQRLLAAIADVLGLDASDDSLVAIADHSHYETYAKGERIYTRSQATHSLKCVLRGRVKISTLGRGGQEVLMGVVERGKSFSLVAAIDGGPETSHAVALTRTEILSVEREVLVTALEREPTALWSIAQELCRQTRVITGLIASLGIHDAGARLLSRLLILAREYGEGDFGDGGLRIAHGLSQQDLADTSGLTRVSVNRQLAAWRAAGLAKIGRGFVEIPDVEALEKHVWSA